MIQNMKEMASEAVARGLSAITPDDRRVFGKRVRARVIELKRSARWLEIEIGVAVGTISKLTSGNGKSVLNAAKLRAIAAALEVPAGTLVDHTGFAALLISDDSEAQRTQALAMAEDSVRRLRTDIVERDAQLVRMRAENTQLTTQSAKKVAGLTAEVATLHSQCAQLYEDRTRVLAQVADTRDHLQASQRRFAQVRERWGQALDERDEAIDQLGGVRAELAQQIQLTAHLSGTVQNLRGELAQTSACCDEWRLRSQQLEHQLVQAAYDGTKTAVITGLAALVTGMKVGARAAI